MLDADGLAHECQARNTIGLHTEYLTRQALQERYGIKRGAALRSFDTLSVDPLKLAAGFRRALANGAQLLAPVTVEDVAIGPEKVYVRTGEGPVLTARYAVYATGYEMPTAVRPTGHTVHSTYTIATKPQPAKLWPDHCHIWEAAAPYLYARTTPDARVICDGEDEPFKMRNNGRLTRAQNRPSRAKLRRLFPSWIVTRPLPGAARSAPAHTACRPSAPFLTGPAALPSWRSVAMALRIAASPPRSLPRRSPAGTMWMPICLP